jgi:protoporphyrinogen oxidase
MPAPEVAVAVLGAGLTGMSAALDLLGRGVEHRIFEKRAEPGGHAVTIVEHGYRFDRTGHLLHLRDPAMRERVLGWIGDDYFQIQRRSVIWSNGVYTRYPFQANTFGLPAEVAYECLMGFLHAHFSKDQPAPKNFEEFCFSNFGEGISNHFMIPYNSRLWGVHPREITSAWCERFVPLPKLEDVMAGAVGLNDRELGYNTNFVYPRLGIGQLSQAMHRALPHIELERTPQAIDWKKRKLHFGGDSVGYRALVSTAPLPALIELLVDVPEDVRAAGKQLRCTHLYYLDVALAAPCRKDVHWIYVPEEKYPFYRVGCYSHFSPAMAPPGKANLYVELAQRDAPDLELLMPRVSSGLVEMGLIAGAHEISFVRLRRIDWAYVIFDHAYFAALEKVRPFLEQAGIVSAGRYGDWNYSSMEDALLFGQKAADAACSIAP